MPESRGEQSQSVEKRWTHSPEQHPDHDVQPVLLGCGVWLHYSLTYSREVAPFPELGVFLPVSMGFLHANKYHEHTCLLSSLLRLLKLVQSISRDLYYPMEDVYD